MSFLPVCRQDLDDRGISCLDFICITGDAYVDHPSFGVAIISRLIESLGYTVGIIAQPQTDTDYKKLGCPKYAFMVTSGCVDSMVSNYTAAKKPRSRDVYSPGGKAGRRPDRAVLVYCNKLRELYGNIPIAIGGLEASLRRFAHYDYWQDKVRNSILVDSGADILMFGMGEYQTKEICRRLVSGERICDITDISGTCVMVDEKPIDAVECAPAERVKLPTEEGKRAYAEATRVQFRQQDPFVGKPIVQRHGKRYLLQNIPAAPLEKKELDAVYALPYMRAYHPSYEAEGGVPAIEEVENSITHNRGCFGGCNFCAIAFHQGTLVTSRSKQSVVNEAVRITKGPNFKGYINDIGGPTANFRHSACDKKSVCKDRKCMAPEICPVAEKNVSHEEYLDILKTVRALPGVKKVFIRSGIRYDYIVADKNKEFFRELIKHHISGQLKVAPEHVRNNVLDCMGKPHFEVYEKFYKEFYKINKQLGLKQYLVPYLISSHPGCTLEDAIELALYLKKINYHPEQVQDFYPTPGTLSCAMFYTGLNPVTMKKVYVPKTPQEKAEQRALLQCTLPKNREIVRRALLKAGRSDLIRVLLPSDKGRC